MLAMRRMTWRKVLVPRVPRQGRRLPAIALKRGSPTGYRQGRALCRARPPAPGQLSDCAHGRARRGGGQRRPGQRRCSTAQLSVRGHVHPILGAQLAVSSARLARAVRQFHGIIVTPIPPPEHDPGPVRALASGYGLCSGGGPSRPA